MADRTIFILGASRGIGLGLVKEFLARGWQVVASERSRSDALHALESEALRIVSCDVTRPDSYADLGFEDGQFDALVISPKLPPSLRPGIHASMSNFRHAGAPRSPVATSITR